MIGQNVLPAESCICVYQYYMHHPPSCAPPSYPNSIITPFRIICCSHSNLHAVFVCILDVVVQLPDKKSIIMYVTSLFAVLPKDVSMEAIREVETLPRKYKAASEDAAVGLSTQVNYTVMFEL